MVTMQQIRAILDSEEPDYALAAQLGPDTLPHIETIIKGADPMIASKAAYLAGLIQDNRSSDVLKIAAKSKYPEVRAAAAAGARHLAAQAASDVLLVLLEDQDIGVRKIALKSVHSNAPLALRKKVESLAAKDPEIFLRTLSSDVLNRLRKNP